MILLLTVHKYLIINNFAMPNNVSNIDIDATTYLILKTILDACSFALWISFSSSSIDNNTPCCKIYSRQAYTLYISPLETFYRPNVIFCRSKSSFLCIQIVKGLSNVWCTAGMHPMLICYSVCAKIYCVVHICCSCLYVCCLNVFQLILFDSIYCIKHVS